MNLNRRGFFSALWGAIAARFAPARLPSFPIGSLENGEETPDRTEIRANPEGGFLVRTFYNPRSSARGGRFIVMHHDADVFVSKYVGGELPPPRAATWLGKVRRLFGRRPREERC